MICPVCKKESGDTAAYCIHCGHKLTHPAKKKKKDGPGIFLRILFTVCASVLALLAFKTLAVGIFGKSTEATGIRLSFGKEEPNGNGNDYEWWLHYDYSVDGKDYSGYTVWHGTRWSPDSGTGSYHVNYLPLFPRISQFEKYRPLLHAQSAADFFAGGGKTLLATAAGLAASYLLLYLAFPRLPFFRRKRKKRKRAKQTESKQEEIP